MYRHGEIVGTKWRRPDCHKDRHPKRSSGATSRNEEDRWQEYVYIALKVLPGPEGRRLLAIGGVPGQALDAGSTL